MQKPTMYVVGGPNGAGKTTLALEFQREIEVPYIAADKIAAEISPADPPLARLRAGRNFLKSITAQIHLANSMVVESTLSGRGFLRTIDRAHQAGFSISISFVYVDSADTCVSVLINESARAAIMCPKSMSAVVLPAVSTTSGTTIEKWPTNGNCCIMATGRCGWSPRVPKIL